MSMRPKPIRTGYSLDPTAANIAAISKLCGQTEQELMNHIELAIEKGWLQRTADGRIEATIPQTAFHEEGST